MAEPDDTLPQEAPAPPSIPGKCVELRLATVGAVTHVYALVELADGANEWRYQACPLPLGRQLLRELEEFCMGEWVKRSPHA